MGATSLGMAERAETRGRPHTAHVRPRVHGGDGGLDAPSHTNALIHTITYQAIDQTYFVHGTCFDYGVEKDGCRGHEFVGTEDASLAGFWRQSKSKKSKRKSRCDATVGSAGNDNSNANCNSKGNAKHVRFLEASFASCEDLRHEFP